MADDATITISATVLPDEIAKTIAGTMTLAPADANDKWYYKITSVANASTDLIAGYFTDYTAVDDDTAPTAVATRVSDALRAIGLELSKSTIASAAILLVVTIGISVEDITALRVRSTAEVCKLFT